jgi:DNA polymerase-3 subunit delta
MHTAQSIINDLKAGKVQSLYFLMGEEPFFIDQVSTYFETALLPEAARGFDQTVVYGKDTTIDMLVSNAKRYPMISDRQLIIVKEAQNLSRNIEQLLPYAKQPQPSTTLVLCYKYKSLDKRKALYKALSKRHIVLDSKRIYDSKIPAWISSHLQYKTLQITPKAAHLLAEFLGNDLVKITNELGKLELVVGEDRNITPELIEHNIGISKDFNNFELQNALANGNQVKAYQIVQYFSKNSNQHAIVLTIATLYSFFSKIMTLHTVDSQNPQTMAKAIGVNPYFLKDYTMAARHFPMHRISGVFETLRLMDVKSKGVDANLSPKDLYQELLFRIFKV